MLKTATNIPKYNNIIYNILVYIYFKGIGCQLKFLGSQTFILFTFYNLNYAESLSSSSFNFKSF